VIAGCLVTGGRSPVVCEGWPIDPAELRLAMLWQLSPERVRRLRLQGTLAGLPAWRELPSSEKVEREIARMRDLQVGFLVLGGPGFPERLAAIPDPPPYLFVRGTPRLDAAVARVAIVGSRAASESGRDVAYALGRDLALAGVEVVSGMARGIDAAAHWGALDAGGRSVAVCGTGADVCYPAEHDELLRRLLRSGGIVTEFPLGTPGLRLHFPRRNRIISGLADVVVVVEGGERSGARSTVDHALDQGREVMAVPRDPLLPGSVLPDRLLRDGAAVVCGAVDILDVLRAGPVRPGVAAPSAVPGGARTGGNTLGESAAETAILEALAGRRRSLDDLLRLGAATGAGAGAVQALLLRLELEGRVRRSPGGWFHRTG